VIVSHYPRRALLSRHRDEDPLTASPLESALTNCDARNPFRMRSYENTRVAYPLDSIFLRPSLCRAKSPSANPLISMRCALFHFPYPATPLFATLTKGAGCIPTLPILVHPQFRVACPRHRGRLLRPACTKRTHPTKELTQSPCRSSLQL